MHWERKHVGRIDEREAEQYFANQTGIIPLYEMNVAKLAEPYHIEVS